MDIREQILKSMARTVFVTAYADACDEYDNTPLDAEANERFADAPRACRSGDWMDVAPDAAQFMPCAAIEAWQLAVKMLNKFVSLNGEQIHGTDREQTMQTLLDEWCSSTDRIDRNAGTFGHYLAMQSLGHGVGLNDNICPGSREWKTGHFEGIKL